jgi:hypothetical protein
MTERLSRPMGNMLNSTSLLAPPPAPDCHAHKAGDMVCQMANDVARKGQHSVSHFELALCNPMLSAPDTLIVFEDGAKEDGL